MYKIMMFEGGVYKFNELKELIEDIGGFILQESVMQTETMMHLTFPEEEERVIRDKIKELGGKFKELPLAGTEIVLVVPSLGKHHAVDPICDISEYLRRKGAITNMLALERGVGKRIAQMTAKEKKIIEEFDAAVFVFGNLKECIEEKVKLCSQIVVPYVIVGGPPDLTLDHYVGGVGRKSDRMRRTHEFIILEEIAEDLRKVIDDRRREIEEDPLAAAPLFVKDMIEMVIPQTAGEELLNIMHLEGLRVNIEENVEERLRDVAVGNKKLSEISELKQSLFKGYLLTIKTEAEVGSIY